MHLTQCQQALRKRLTSLAVLVVAVGAVTILPSAVSAYTPPRVIGWETLLPGLPTASNPQFHGLPGCETPTMACIDWEIAQLDAVRVHFGCDHRAVFATTYELLTIQLRHDMLADLHLFDDPAWVIGEDVTFASMYFASVHAYETGGTVPQAWRVAFDTAAGGDANAVQDMLLGINAHVQRDMPFMMAAVGLHTPSGASRKHDHDVVNLVLNRAFESVTDTIRARFDPVEGFISPKPDPLLGYVGNVMGDQVVQAWREQVWRNAEQLLNATTVPKYTKVARGIETNATSWARLIASVQVPGYRAFRDRYCSVHNVGPLARS